jgi:hypothetical protein
VRARATLFRHTVVTSAAPKPRIVDQDDAPRRDCAVRILVLDRTESGPISTARLDRKSLPVRAAASGARIHFSGGDIMFSDTLS